MRKIFYLKTGISFLALFIASVVAVTWVQTENNRADMERVFVSATEMGKEVTNNIESYNETKLNTEVLMWLINGKINGFVSNSWNNHNIYSSVLLLDSSGQVMSQSGYMLRIAPATGTENHWHVPLGRFCSDEQIDLIYRTFRSQIGGEAISVCGEIKGYIDNLDQWIPQQLILRSKEDESITIELDFDIESDNNSRLSHTFEDAIIWIAGPGSFQCTSTNTDRKILKECDALAISNIKNAQENQLGAVGMSNETYLEFNGIGTITIDDELYYFAIGGKGFPLRAAISELVPLYIYLLAVMMIVFFIVSRGFIKQYKRQKELVSNRRMLTVNAAVKLKEPLNVINKCGTELRQSIPDEKRTNLLDTIINKTEQMDTTVRELLTSAQTGKGNKDEKR